MYPKNFSIMGTGLVLCDFNPSVQEAEAFSLTNVAQGAHVSWVLLNSSGVSFGLLCRDEICNARTHICTQINESMCTHTH